MTKNLIIAAAIIAAFILGFLLGKSGGGSKPTILALQANINLQGDGSCQQVLSNGSNTPFPDLSKARLDSISWTGGSAATAPRVSFSPNPSPFAQNSFSGGISTGGPVNGSVGQNYTFGSVSVFNPNTNQWQQCSNPQAMGVHITN